MSYKHFIRGENPIKIYCFQSFAGKYDHFKNHLNDAAQLWVKLSHVK